MIVLHYRLVYQKLQITLSNVKSDILWVNRIVLLGMALKSRKNTNNFFAP